MNNQQNTYNSAFFSFGFGVTKVGNDDNGHSKKNRITAHGIDAQHAHHTDYI